MNEHTDGVNTELCWQGLNQLLLVRWTDKIKALKQHHEQQSDPRVIKSSSLHSLEHFLLYYLKTVIRHMDTIVDVIVLIVLFLRKK
jgi:hypothetical protein